MTFDEAIAAVIRNNPALPEITAIYYDEKDTFNTKETCVVHINLQEEKYPYTGAGSVLAVNQVAEIAVIVKRTNPPGRGVKIISTDLIDVILKNPRLNGFLVVAGRFIGADSGEVLLNGTKADYVRVNFEGKYFRGVS